jgi:hypothetical protein
VVVDVSDRWESRPLGELVSSVLPYGFLQCTCEKYPRITYINQALSDYLYIGDDPGPWAKNARDNVYFMVPFEERELFRQYLDKAAGSTRPIWVDHHMFRWDGTQAHLSGWLSMVPGDSGKKEFALIYRQVEDPAPTEPIQDTSYFPVLKRAYNSIFELDLNTQMVECIHGLDNSPIGPLSGIQMTLESARQICLNNYIYTEDRAMMTAYLDQVCDPADDWHGRSVLQADFRLKLPGGNIFRVIGVAVHLDTNQVLLCCRDVTHLTYSGAQARESKTLHSLNEWLDYLSIHSEGTVGMLMLEETQEGCSLLYGTSSVLRYLGLDTEDSPHRSTPPSLAECLSAADLTQEEFQELTGGKNLYLWSRNAPDAFQFQLTCKTYHNGTETLYIIWCSTNDLQPEPSNKRVFARTFGHFDLFLDNSPITFSSAKEKELMALLIDRNGGTLSPNEAISYLWEDEAADERTSARYRKLAMGLKRTLEKYGIEDILVNHNGIRSIDTSAIRCDYYELLAGNPKYRQAFHNAYMTDYSWAEETLATLWDYSATPS